VSRALTARRTRLWGLVLVLFALTLAACSSSADPTSAKTKKASASHVIISGPQGLLAGTPPSLSGEIWLLAANAGAKNLRQLDLLDHKLGTPVPVTGTATSLAQSSSTLLGLGIATATTGAVEFLDGANASLFATVAIGAPVHALAAGADGSTFYALNGNGSSMSVTLIDSLTKSVIRSIPAPIDTVSIAVDPTGQRIFALESSGEISVLAASDGTVDSRFPVGADPRDVALSGDGSTLYVLKGSARTENVGVIEVTVQKQLRALPAPAHTMDIVVSSNNRTLYAFVGTATIGNVQLLNTK